MFKVGMLANIPRLRARRDLDSAVDNQRDIGGAELFRLTLLATEDVEAARRAEYRYIWETMKAGRTPK